MLPGTLWGITTFFNPIGYSSKLSNLKAFAMRVREQGLSLLIVEAALGQSPFSVQDAIGDLVVRLRVPDAIWLKEKLINVGLRSLPSECDKVAWLDCDILFENNDWVSEVSHALGRYAVIQPFQTAYWLGPNISFGQDAYSMNNCVNDSYYTRPSVASEEFVNQGGTAIRGHMGYAWAIRRDILQRCPLYDRLAVGGADYVITSAMYGLSAKDFLEHTCTHAMCLHIHKWMKVFHSLIRGSVGYLDGNLFHLWHGDRMNRHYVSRFRILKEENFDPLYHLVDDGSLRWRDPNSSLSRKVHQYFVDRRED